MNSQVFSYTQPIVFGWERFKRYWKMMLGLFVVMFGVSLIGGAMVEFVNQNIAGVLGSLLQLGLWLVSMTLQLAMMMMALWVVDDKGEDLNGFVEAFMARVSPRWVGYYILASILMGLIVLLGFVLLIVPGIILMVMLQFYGLAFVDGQVGVRAPLRRSREITSGHKMQLFVFMLVLLVFNILGLLALVVGVVVTSAISSIALAYVYRALSGGQTQRTQPVQAPEQVQQMDSVNGMGMPRVG